LSLYLIIILEPVDDAVTVKTPTSNVSAKAPVAPTWRKLPWLHAEIQSNDQDFDNPDGATQGPRSLA
jgi:hypothetical protein